MEEMLMVPMVSIPPLEIVHPLLTYPFLTPDNMQTLLTVRVASPG